MSAVLAAVVLIFLGWISLPDARRAQDARSAVEAAYAEARGGSTDRDWNPALRWKENRNLYGPVLDYRIVSQRKHLFGSSDYSFDVRVTRTRAVTEEHVEAWAGYTKSYGYTTQVSNIRVVRATPTHP